MLLLRVTVLLAPWSPAATKSLPGASVTVRLTVRSEVGAGVALTLNAAPVPSVTGEVTAVMVTTGGGGGPPSSSFTVTVAVFALPTA